MIFVHTFITIMNHYYAEKTEWIFVSFLSTANVPISVTGHILHLPPPNKEMVRISLLEKSNSPPTGNKIVLKSPCSIPLGN